MTEAPPTIFQRLRDLVADHLSVPEKSLCPETVLGKDIRCDSLDYISLVAQIELEFSVDFTPKEISATAETLSKIVDLIESKVELTV